MIDGRSIKFGYGDITVGYNRKQLVLREIPFTVPVGSGVIDSKKYESCTDSEKERIQRYYAEWDRTLKIGDLTSDKSPILIRFSTEDDVINFLYNIFDVLHGNADEFMFHGYTFNFSKFNIESIRIILGKLSCIVPLLGLKMKFDENENKLILENNGG